MGEARDCQHGAQARACRVCELVAEVDGLRRELAVAQSFHAVAVRERDCERTRVDWLRAEVERLQAAHDHQHSMAGLMLREAERAEAEVERLTRLLANVFDNLNDLPIGDEWARLTCERISAALRQRGTVNHESAR